MNEFYDEFADRNGWGPGQPLQRWLSRRILSELLRVSSIKPANTRLLEVGCGSGNTGRAAIDLGFLSYMAVEPNPILADVARAKVAPCQVVQARLPELTPELIGVADVAVAIHVIEHARSGYEAHDWVDALRRTVTPGGLILIVSPDVRDFKASFWDIDWSHGFPTTTTNLSQICLDLGMEIVCSKKMRSGTIRSIPTALALGVSLLIPTRILDALSRRIVHRDLATGFKVAVLWGVTFVVAKNRNPGGEPA